jgi:hypothetical protein
VGNANNPPDSMLKGGDAIEVKKVGSHSSQIQLNSSFPKDKLHSHDRLITRECVNCEEWDVSRFNSLAKVLAYSILIVLIFSR